jgi:hypothetical protein
MAGVGASMGAHGELTGEGKEGERRRGGRGARLGGGMGRRRAAGGAPWGLNPAASLASYSVRSLCVR